MADRDPSDTPITVEATVQIEVVSDMRARPRISADQRRALLKPPPVLYHYTSTAGFIGILESHRFWAGDARQMNDTEELIYARQVAARVAARLLNDPTCLAALPGKALLEDVANGSYRYFEWDRYFVVCFSENADQLSQWRAYADDGLGYAIGIRAGAHFSAAGPRSVVLERVIYDDKEQDDLLEGILRDAAIAADRDGGDRFLQDFWEVLAIIKNPAFSEEKEWRLIVQDWRGDGVGPRFRFMPSRFGVAAKIEIGCVSEPYRPPTDRLPPETLTEATLLPLVHVVAGPRTSDENAAYRLVEQCGYWVRCETLDDAMRGEQAVFLADSSASYR